MQIHIFSLESGKTLDNEVNPSEKGSFSFRTMGTLIIVQSRWFPAGMKV